MVRKIVLIKILCLYTLVSYGQSKKPINECVQSIVKTQISKSIENEVVLILNISGIIYFQKVVIPNDIIYYKEGYRINSQKLGLNKIAMNEIQENLKSEFVNEQIFDKDLLLKAYIKNRLLFSLNYSNDGDTQRVNLSSLSNNHSRTFSYKDCNMVSSTTCKKEKVKYYKSITYNPLLANSSSESSIDKISFKTGNDYKQVQQHFYDSHNLSSKILTIGKDGKVKDSMLFEYKDDKLIFSKNYAGKKAQTIQYRYDSNGKIIEKNILSNKKMFTINYLYNKEHLLNRIKITNKRSGKSKEVEVLYNENSNIVSVSVFKGKERKVQKLNKQFNFCYDSTGTITKLREVKRNGKVKKDIDFEMVKLIGSK